MEKNIKIDEGNLFYEMSESKGPDMVLLHGFPFSRKMWKPQMDFFGKKYRVIAPDFRCHGDSLFKNFPWTLSHLADDLKELLDSLNSRQVVLCGLSMGGYVALEFMAKYPDYVKGLVLCDTKAGADNNQDKEKRMIAMKEISSNGNIDFAHGFAKKCVFENAEHEKIVYELAVQNQPFEMVSTLLALSARKDQRELLPAIKCPTLIMCGEKDLITPPADSEELHKNIKNSEYIVIPKAGHVSNLQNSAFFNQSLLDFVEKVRRSFED